MAGTAHGGGQSRATGGGMRPPFVRLLAGPDSFWKLATFRKTCVARQRATPMRRCRCLVAMAHKDEGSLEGKKPRSGIPSTEA
jgi:hypothetical protein